MKFKKRLLISIIFVLTVVVITNYSEINGMLTKSLIEDEIIFVNRVIDGDTIESNKTSIRLLGINTPEKGEEFYLEAKAFLEKEILNKSVTLEYGKTKK